MHKHQKVRSMEMNSIKNAILSEMLESSEQDINLVFDKHYSSLDLEDLQNAAFAAIKSAKKTVFQSKIISAEHKSKAFKPQATKSWTANQIESALKTFFNSPSSQGLAVAFRNYTSQSPADQASLLEDLIRLGSINPDDIANQ